VVLFVRVSFNIEAIRTNSNTDFFPSRKSNANTADVTSILIYCFDRIANYLTLTRAVHNNSHTWPQLVKGLLSEEGIQAMLLEGEVEHVQAAREIGATVLSRLGELDVGQVAATGRRRSSMCAGSAGTVWPRGKAETVGPSGAAVARSRTGAAVPPRRDGAE
jgi:hypothetical protein